MVRDTCMDMTRNLRITRAVVHTAHGRMLLQILRKFGQLQWETLIADVMWRTAAAIRVALAPNYASLDIRNLSGRWYRPCWLKC